MTRHSQIVKSVAYALRHLDDKELLSLAELTSLEVVQKRMLLDSSQTPGQIVQQVLTEILEDLLIKEKRPLRDPTSQYLDLRYRRGLAMKHVARQMGFSREYITRRYRRAAIHRVVAALASPKQM